MAEIEELVIVCDIGDSKRIQEFLFAKGYEWRNGRREYKTRAFEGLESVCFYIKRETLYLMHSDTDYLEDKIIDNPKYKILDLRGG